MKCRKTRSPENLWPKMYNNCHCISGKKMRCPVRLSVLMFRNLKGKIIIQKAVVDKCGKLKANQTIFKQKEKEFLLLKNNEYRKKNYNKLSSSWMNNIHNGLRKMFDNHIYLRFGR
ncbi:Hypothetical protein SRAE_2000288500 [Strongyloides ratti]|uniref:Uncharacterized protein n=1 Tax=Strongyloides ratti TaxID=34506 RepID=A0A090LER7_STRRB|nr:Hypothetical protein SRAE_2000288500 [Strongyloides ratti]CEF68227.1 Hypothetical protein SRAE_2000288500 [Strongyloides ratti]